MMTISTFITPAARISWRMTEFMMIWLYNNQIICFQDLMVSKLRVFITEKELNLTELNNHIAINKVPMSEIRCLWDLLVLEDSSKK